MEKTHTILHTHVSCVTSIAKGNDMISHFQKAEYFEFLGVKFVWDEDINKFHPIEGPYSTLGTIIPILEYSWEDLLFLLEHQTAELSDAVVPKEPLYATDDNNAPLTLHFHGLYDLGSSKLFDNIQTSSHIDYPGTITWLQKKKVIQTRPSTQFLSTDGRQFLIMGEWLEVDILGTTMAWEVTQKVVSLYKTLEYEESKSNNL